MKAWGFDLVNGDNGGRGPERFTETMKSEISHAKVGKKLSADHIKSMSEARKGLPFLSRCVNGHEYRTKETFNKISVTKTGVKHSEKRKEKIRKIHYDKSQLSKEDVISIFYLAKLGGLFQKQIAHKYGISQSDVSNIKNKVRFVEWTQNL